MALALGFLVGFAIALSPGPIFFLVLRRTLARGWRSGFVSALGVATGDATYAALAANGVAAVTTVLLAEPRWIGLLGGIAISLIGLRTLRERPLPDPPPQAGEGKWRAGSASESRRRSSEARPPLRLRPFRIWRGHDRRGPGGRRPLGLEFGGDDRALQQLGAA
jgi:threonine/homoserine/homoserine lactone efflux protein